MGRRKRRPEPAVVTARPPQWILWGSVLLGVLLVWPPIAAIAAGEAGVGLVALGLWPLLLIAIMWRSRLVVDSDGATFRFLSSRHVPWSQIEALVGATAKAGARGQHLRVRDGRPIPINPSWQLADGDSSVVAAIEPWARRNRVRVEGTISATAAAPPRYVVIGMLMLMGAAAGMVFFNITGG